MKNWFFAGAVSAAALVLARGVGPDAAGGPPSPPGWFTDYAKAKADARQSGKPLFVVFRCQP